jgi:shikimate dehydrogenase
MQAAAFASAGLHAVYEAIDVEPGGLGDALARLHARGYAGLNLTAPLKERALRFAGSVTPEGARLGSVNTLKREGGGWAAHATDGLGFEAWALEASLPFRGARVALLGAGGAARAIAPYLASLGAATIVVVGRDAARVADVIDGAADAPGGAAWSPGSWQAGPDEGAGGGIGAFDLIVRSLSAPDPVSGEEPWWRAVAPGGTVVDLNYGPRAGTSRQRAAALGLRFEDGRGMLLHQGALAFTYWTGRPAPLEAMRRALEAALN